MKRYNLSQIMKTAHNLRKNCPAKYPTFSAALKQSWKIDKFDAWRKEQRSVLKAENEAQETKREALRETSAKEHAINEARRQAQRKAQEAKAQAQRLIDEAQARKQGISYNEYQNRISWQMGYGRGMYCGD